MPDNIMIAAFVLGAVLLLISIIGGKFKIFGAEVSVVVGPAGRTFAGIAGAILIGIGLNNSLPVSQATQAEKSTRSSVEEPQQPVIKPAPAVKPEALPVTFVLEKLTCIRPQEPGGEDRVYLKLGDLLYKEVWKLKAGESVSLNLIVEAGTDLSLWEKDGIRIDGDDDFLGKASLDRGGKLRFELPETGNHLYTLNYRPEN